MSTPLNIHRGLLANISLGADFYIACGLIGEGEVLSMADIRGPLADKIKKICNYGKDNQHSTRAFKHSACAAASEFIAEHGFTPLEMDPETDVIGLMLKSGYHEIDQDGNVLFQRPTCGKRPIEVACLDNRGRRVTISTEGKICLRWTEAEGWVTRKVAHGKYYKEQMRKRVREGFAGEGTRMTEVVRLGDTPSNRTVLELDGSIVITETGTKARVTQTVIQRDEEGRVTSVTSTRGKQTDVYTWSQDEVYKNGKFYFGV
ncbi:hypothetical protein [Vibrio phage vB_pir03]|nr:hypothetical protein [Vibrio phage vB_pir03]